MRILFFFFLLFLLKPIIVLGSIGNTKILSSNYTFDYLNKNIVSPMTFTPVPPYGDSYWLDSIPLAMRNSYIKEAEKYIGTCWESTNIMLFSEYVRNGNRSNFQNFSFNKRGKLAILALGEIMEGKGRFLPDIFNGMFSICEETWWGVPSHYGSIIPFQSKQTLDLFNAQTGGLMAWMYYMFKEPIRDFTPLLEKRILEEISRRILVEGKNSNQWWREANSNWNPWICSNWLSCILLAESNREKQIEYIQLVLNSLDGFIDKYPQDGGCDEGPHYWERATGALLDCLVLLKKASNGLIDLSSNKKIQSMSNYIVKMNIGNGYFVNFADANTKIIPHVDWFPSALYLQNYELMSLSANTALNENYFTDPSATFVRDNFGSINRELSLLTVLKELQKVKPREVLAFDSWFPGIEVLTARSIPNSTKGLFLAVKGGHNAENHNHNDVGSFIIYADGKPLFIDPGNEIYRKETAINRYNIWCLQSGYHNLPKINGVDQKNGRRYMAKDVKEFIDSEQVSFSLNIADAYPKDAAVQSWVREILFKRNEQVVVTEKFKLEKYKKPTEIIFMSPIKPKLLVDRVVFALGDVDYALLFDKNTITPSFEAVNLSDKKLKATWGNQLYRIKLRIISKDAIGEVKYIIKPIELCN